VKKLNHAALYSRALERKDIDMKYRYFRGDKDTVWRYSKRGGLEISCNTPDNWSVASTTYPRSVIEYSELWEPYEITKGYAKKLYPLATIL